MKRILLCAGLALAVSLAGCSTIEKVVQGTSTATVTEANTAAQVELGFTALEKGLHLYLTSVSVSAADAQVIGDYNTKVYLALVAVRTAVESGQNPVLAAKITLFNAAVTDLKTYVNSKGGAL